MSKLFYPKLAASNIKKNGAIYLPYLLTCIFTVALFYIMRSLSLNEGIKQLMGAETIHYTMGLGCWVAAFFSAIFLFYTNSFLMKRRKKEFGLFHVLGMEKKHISRVVGLETLYLGVLSLAAGLLLGIALDKGMYLLIMRVLGYEVPLGFYISGRAILDTVVLYCVIFFLILLYSLAQIHTANPIELLQSKSVGEREPKTKGLMALLGVVCLGVGYAISVTNKNPIAALFEFFLAVLLVILGTYLLFTAGSIALLKLLRKNKAYYYQTAHFTSISGMIYRMKQNAVGLANICILSTMVLVMISSTASLMIGIEDIAKTRYPYDITVYADGAFQSDKNKALEADVQDAVAAAGLEMTDEIAYPYLSFAALRQGDEYLADLRVEGIDAMDNIVNLFFIPLADYNRTTGEAKQLAEGQVLVYSNREKIPSDTITVCGRSYEIAEKLNRFVGNGMLAANIASTQFIVVPDEAEIDFLEKAQQEIYGKQASSARFCCGFDLTGTEEEQAAAYENFLAPIAQEQDNVSIESRAFEHAGILSLYGGLFFVGIFLGLLFILATVLIIYYKQISEGYDDRERFEIMQKVGMSRAEVKKSIHAQIITVFFLPLVTAGVHVAFAFPIISNILAIFNLTNTALFIACTVGCFLVFALLYGAIYAVTAKSYYRIVSKKSAS